MKTDISSRSDIQQLVHEFYRRLLADPTISHVFHGLNLETHLPKVEHFWAFVLLGAEGYTTNVFQKHMHLPIQPEYFQIWLRLFTNTVNDLFDGPVATLAVQRATVLAFTFESKWKQIHP